MKCKAVIDTENAKTGKKIDLILHFDNGKSIEFKRDKNDKRKFVGDIPPDALEEKIEAAPHIAKAVNRLLKNYGEECVQQFFELAAMWPIIRIKHIKETLTGLHTIADKEIQTLVKEQVLVPFRAGGYQKSADFANYLNSITEDENEDT